MNFPLYIARRISLGSQGHRSSPAVKVAVAAVALSVAVMLASVAIVLGFKREIREKIIGFNSHISLYAVPTEDGDNVVTMTPSLRALLDSVPYVTDYSLEASIPAILKTPDNFKGVYMKSLAGEGTRRFIASSLEEGKIPEYGKEGTESGDKGNGSLKVVISRIAANQLGLGVGDRVDTYFITDDVRVRRLEVSGIFNTHFDTYDDLYLYGDLALIQRLGQISADRGTSVAVNTDDFNRVTEYTGDLHNRLLTAVADGTLYRYYNVDNAYNQGIGYFYWLSLLDTNVVVILVLMTFVAIMTLISGMLIIILDKKPFIGLMRALGASERETRRIFQYIAMRVAVVGLLIGNGAGLAILLAQRKWHFIPLDPDAYYIDFVPVELGWLPVVLLNVAVIAVIYLCLVLPSRFVSKIPPAAALRPEE